jgi:hypothetical protein
MDYSDFLHEMMRLLTLFKIGLCLFTIIRAQATGMTALWWVGINDGESGD